MEENRYMRNVIIVRKIAENFGMRLISFDPSWTFMHVTTEQPKSDLELVVFSYSDSRTINVNDDFIGKVAIVMGYDWEFEKNVVEMKDNINKINQRINMFKQQQTEVEQVYDRLNKLKVNEIPKFEDKQNVDFYNSVIQGEESLIKKLEFEIKIIENLRKKFRN